MYGLKLLGGDPASWLSRAINGGGAAASTLLNGLVSYWTLDEQSGTRADSVGDNDLTDNNTVGAVNRGPVGTVAKFVDSDQDYLSTASESSLEGSGESWTIAMWVNLVTPDNNNGRIFARETGGLDYALLGGPGGITLYAVGTSTTKVDPLVGWHLIACGFDKANNNIWASVDGGSRATGATTGPYSAAAAKVFQFSDAAYGRGDQTSSAGFWRAALLDATLASLFASGNGKRYADLTAAEKVGLVSYWDLSEVSGQRNDSHGSNHLTDNNTVLSVVNAGGAMDGGAASFVAASSESLTKDDVLGLTDTDFTVAVWSRLTNAAVRVLIGKTNTGTTGWMIYTDGTNYIANFGSDIGGNYSLANTNHTIALNEWALVILTHNATTKATTLQTNNGTANSITMSDSPQTVANPFEISGGLGQYYWNGEIDEVGIWSRVLTADERAELYAAGAGKFYNFS